MSQWLSKPMLQWSVVDVVIFLALFLAAIFIVFRITEIFQKWSAQRRWNKMREQQKVPSNHGR